MVDANTIYWYDQNADEFGQDSLRWTPFDQLDEFSLLLPPETKVLDAGCGAGRDTNELVKRGLDAVGVDASAKLIEVAKKFFPKIKFAEADVCNLPFKDGSFGGIWCHAVLLHLENDRQVMMALGEFFRVLQVGGIVHILVKSKRDNPKTELVTGGFNFKGQRLFQYFSATELEKLLTDSGFKVKLINEFNESDRPNGREGVFWIKVLAEKI